MFDVSTISKRYFEVKIEVEDEDGKKYSADLEVEPPKLKALKKLTSIAKTVSDKKADDEDDAMDDLHDAMRIILNKNKAKQKVSNALIENLDTDQMEGILASFFGWLSSERKNPN